MTESAKKWKRNRVTDFTFVGCGPVPDDTRVDLRFRDGMVVTNELSGNWCWWKDGDASDIVAWRLAENEVAR